jgi:serine acetyltransferase
MSNHEMRGDIGMPVLSDPVPEAMEPPVSASVLWDCLRAEAEDACRRAPQLASLFLDSILSQPSFEAAVIHRVASRLKNDVIPLPLIVRAFQQAVATDKTISVAFRSDITAVRQSDQACGRFIEPLLYFKGFHAIQTHRWLTGCGTPASAVSVFICRAAPRRCSRPTSIQRRDLGRASSSPTPPV